MQGEQIYLIPLEESKLKEIIKQMFLEAIQESGIGMSTNQQKDWGGIELAMEETGLSKQTIYNLVNKQKIKFHKNGRLYFSRAELREFMANTSNKDITKYMK